MTGIDKVQELKQRLARLQGTELVPTVVRVEPIEVMPSVAAVGPAYRISRCAIGLTLIGSSLVLALTSMRANAWFGYALSVDETAGGIFATLCVAAEVIAFVLPTANRLYRQAGDRLAALRGWAMALVASVIVAFAASGFVLTNVSERTASRSASAPAVEVAQRALADVKAARDRECVKLGPVCRLREDTLIARQNELIEVMGRAAAAADPQAVALGVDPARLALVRAAGLVAMCLLAGLVLSHGWGLVFRH